MACEPKPDGCGVVDFGAIAGRHLIGTERFHGAHTREDGIEVAGWSELCTEDAQQQRTPRVKRARREAIENRPSRYSRAVR